MSENALFFETISKLQQPLLGGMAQKPACNEVNMDAELIEKIALWIFAFTFLGLGTAMYFLCRKKPDNSDHE